VCVERTTEATSVTEVCPGAQQTVDDEATDEWSSRSRHVSIQRVGTLYSVDNTVEENSSVFSVPNLNVLVAVSKGMLAVKLCTNRSLQFLTGGSD